MNEQFTEQYKQLQISGSAWSYGSEWGNQMENAVKEIFGPMEEEHKYRASVLDVGCGEGRGLVALYEMGFSRHNLIGVDIAPEKIAVAREKGFLVLDEDFHKLTPIPNKYFDYVFTSHTLEHAYDLKLAFKSIVRVCKNTVYFVVPIGETKEEVDKYNPSHTSPIKDESDITKILDELLLENKSIQSYTLEHKNRACKEIWGIIKI